MRAPISVIAGLLAPTLLAFSPSADAETRYVDAGLTTGADDGTSWADALRGSKGLQTALGMANPGDEIFVAEGIYKPSQAAAEQLSFVLESGVQVYGGFRGTESSADERPAFGAAPSVLSGQLIQGNASFNVVRAENVDSSAVLDGFTVRNGCACDYPLFEAGGGMLCINASPTVQNCRFEQNGATLNGAAVAIQGSGTGPGAAFLDCVFEDNETAGSPDTSGAVSITGAETARFERCVFRGNRGGIGGGLSKASGSGALLIVNCLFFENAARQHTYGGGALYMGDAPSVQIINSTFVGNVAENHHAGGLRMMSESAPTIVNSVFWGNLGASGAHASPNQISGPANVTHSIVEGGFPGAGNLDVAPLFIDRMNADLRLSIHSPAIDAGDNAGVSGSAELDLAHNPRLTQIPSAPDTGSGVARIVDMGAFEFPWPPVAAFCAGDGTASPCPCGNEGAGGAGCPNGAFPAGCAITAEGVPSLSGDTLVLTAARSAPGRLGLFFQGDAATNSGMGASFGDGLRCAGSNVVRLELEAADPLGNVRSSIQLSVAGASAVGDVTRYQWWYRDPQASPCGTGFNLSNGLEVQWVP